MHYTELEKEGYTGTDVSFDIALFEYGLVWKEINKDEYRFYYAVGYDNAGMANMFDWCDMTKKDFEEMINDDWFNLQAVLSYCGQDNLSFPYDISTSISYHGRENVFGSSYYPFEIEGNEEI